MDGAGFGGAGLKVAIDVGGTFTDIVIASSEQQLATYKILSLPEKLGETIDACIEDAFVRLESKSVGTIVHGTTACSNAVLEGKGSKTGFLCTRGFRDLLEIRYGHREPTNDIFWDRLPPLVPRRLSQEIDERSMWDGAVRVPLDENSVRRAAEALKAQNVEAVAIALLHSYANPSHEQRVAKILREILPGVAICASSDVLPEAREYPRASTTVINAYLMKLVERYINDLEGKLSRHGRPILIMQSNGGIMSSTHARSLPVRMLESGPAAGVLAAMRVAQELNLPRVVAFDMGGTTCKACLIEDGEASESHESEIGAGANTPHGRGSGHALRVPGFDIVEIGAGGGSIAHIDDGTLLRVGPQSASAEPGPVCYGRGGTQPTVTDANVTLGYINPEGIAGGTVAIDAAAARGVIGRALAEPLKTSVAEAAHGVYRVANSTMARAIRAVTSERGRDPRDYALIAFGGSGPIHAAELAAETEMSRVYVPLLPGLFSSVGLQFADQKYDRVKSVMAVLTDAYGKKLLEDVKTVTHELCDDLREKNITGTMHYEAHADLRYVVQATEITVRIPDDADANSICQRLRESFHVEQERNFGYRRPDEKVMLVNIRVNAILTMHGGSARDLLRRRFDSSAESARTSPKTRPAYFGATAGEQSAQVLNRAHLVNNPVSGPVIIEEFDPTIVVPPGWTAALDEFANVVMVKGSRP